MVVLRVRLSWLRVVVRVTRGVRVRRLGRNTKWSLVQTVGSIIGRVDKGAKSIAATEELCLVARTVQP